MSWDKLIQHPYLNDLDVNMSNKSSDLTLSYHENSGLFSATEPHGQLNEKNAILINTKDPVPFQETYEKTIEKNLEHFEKEVKNHAEEQLRKVSLIENKLGKS